MRTNFDENFHYSNPSHIQNILLFWNLAWAQTWAVPGLLNFILRSFGEGNFN